MTDLNQNFSTFVGNETEVLFDLGPDDNGLNLEFVTLTWNAYPQVTGIPTMNAPLISKGVGTGIEVTDPLLMQFTITLLDSDTLGLAGNYYHEVRIDAGHGAITTAATGLMTVIDPTVVTNVVAFKSMFPDFAAVDDTVIQIALDAAAQFVDDSWAASQAAAIMFLAAHFLATAQATSASDGRTVTSETIGRMSIAYSTGASSATGSNSSALATTRYGVVFDNMMTAQGYGIAVV